MHELPLKPSGASQAYAKVKARAQARSAALVLAGQEIAPLPPTQGPARRARADGDFRFFCETYFPRQFTLAWSEDHLKVIAKIQRVVCDGEQFAVAMPRGSGKTTLCQTAVLWAVLSGRHPFVFLVASTAEYALAMLNNLKQQLTGNDLLLQDYPESVYPIRRLEGEARRCSGQRYYGVQTHIGWTSEEIVLPTIPGSPASGAVIRVAGIGGHIRGALHTRTDGSSVRPSLVICDDPQTDQSARSPLQIHDRLSVINGAIAGLAGPGKRTAIIIPCTVIRGGDLADQLLDREKNPQWQGERTKLVYQFPTNEKLWQEYAKLRADSLRNDGNGKEATEFYRKHRSQMDAGAVIAWPQRHNPSEISALQHAMNLKLQDEAAFWAEYQNEPLPEQAADSGILNVEQIAAKTHGHKRAEVPVGVSCLTMFVDVQQAALYWMVCGWEPDFTGYILDYGTYPDQKRSYFALREIKRTLQSVHKGHGVEGAIYAGLEALTANLLGREFRRDDGSVLKIERCLVDANWGTSTDVVYQFCRQSSQAALLMPSHGRYVGAASTPFSDYKPKRGDRVGLHWRVPAAQGRRTIRYALIDTNYWKSFVHARLAVAMGDPGCLSLFSGVDHQLLAEHLTSEQRIRTEGRGRQVDEWKLRQPGSDNHWLDCLVGCAVAASMQGALLFGTGSKDAPTKPRIKLSALQGRR